VVRSAIARSAQEAELTEPQFALLWACGRTDVGLSQNELATRIGLSPAHVSGLVEQLSERQLVTGERAAHDRRRQVWVLSGLGRSTLLSVLTELESWSAPLDASLGAGARGRLEADLQQLASALADATGASRARAAVKLHRPSPPEVAVCPKSERPACPKGGVA
jgi:DNA-binding MarR family transcriptional regulator